MEVVKRENGSSDEINFSLRLMNIGKQECEKIKEDLGGFFKLYISSPYENKDLQLILLEDLDDYVEHYPKLLDTIRKHRIREVKINIFISMSTEYDISGFTLPQTISNLFMKIGGSIDFSLIVH